MKSHEDPDSYDHYTVLESHFTDQTTSDAPSIGINLTLFSPSFFTTHSARDHENHNINGTMGSVWNPPPKSQFLT